MSRFWSSGKQRAAKRRRQYEVQCGLCAGCFMPWPIEKMRFRFLAPGTDDRTFDLRCDGCMSSAPDRVSYRHPDTAKWMPHRR